MKNDVSFTVRNNNRDCKFLHPVMNVRFNFNLKTLCDVNRSCGNTFGLTDTYSTQRYRRIPRSLFWIRPGPHCGIGRRSSNVRLNNFRCRPVLFNTPFIQPYAAITHSQDSPQIMTYEQYRSALSRDITHFPETLFLKG